MFLVRVPLHRGVCTRAPAGPTEGRNLRGLFSTQKNANGNPRIPFFPHLSLNPSVKPSSWEKLGCRFPRPTGGLRRQGKEPSSKGANETHMNLVTRPRSVSNRRVFHRRMPQATVPPQRKICPTTISCRRPRKGAIKITLALTSFLLWRNQDVFRLEERPLKVVEDLAHFGDVVNDPLGPCGGGFYEYFSRDQVVDLEGFLARVRVRPQLWEGEDKTSVNAGLVREGREGRRTRGYSMSSDGSFDGSSSYGVSRPSETIPKPFPTALAS